MTEVKKFDPNQPRDEDGKWGSGGGTGASAPEPIYLGKRRGVNPIENPGTYYHVAPNSYKPGDDILSYQALREMGKKPKWKWETDPNTFVDSYGISLHDNLPEAEEHAKEYGGKLLKVEVPEDDGYGDHRGRVNKEGYPTIEDRVPGEWVTVIKPAKKAARKSEEFDGDDMIDTLVSFGGAIKSVEETATGWKFGGWLVCFDTHDVSSLRDRFTKSTDFDIQDGDRRSLYYNHGLDGTVKRTRLGDCHVSVKDAGVWIEGEIKKRDDYLKKHAESIAVNIKRFGLSSGAPAHLVERERVAGGHEVKMWPIAEASITPTPAEPMTGCISLKSLLEIEEAEAAPPETDETKTTEIPDDNLPAGKSFVDHSEQVLATNAEFLERVESLIDMRCIKAGRVLSQANCDRIQGHVDSLQTTVEQMRALLSEHGPQDAANDTKAVEAAQAATKAVEELNAEIDDLEIMFLQQQMKLSQLLSH